MSRNITVAIVSSVALAAFPLAAPASNATEANLVFDFSPDADRGPARQFQITVPNALVEQNTTYAQYRVLDSATARAFSHEGGCAVELNFQFREGAAERVEEDWTPFAPAHIDWSAAETAAPPSNAQKYAILLGLDPQNLSSDFQSAIVPVACSGVSTEANGTAMLALRNPLNGVAFTDDGTLTTVGQPFALVEISVTADGLLYIARAEINS